jgi:phage host-nuclease inhibitor protein Gam
VSEPHETVTLKEYIDTRIDAQDKATRIALEAVDKAAAVRDRYTSLLFNLLSILLGCATLAVFVWQVTHIHGS